MAGRADGGKRILHTIDPKMLHAWGMALTFGAKKYHQRNFLKAPGMAWSRVYDSLLGHLLQFWSGEWLDEESGLPHLAHVLCNLQFLWTYHEHEAFKPSDDRPSSIEYEGRSYEDWEDLFKFASGKDPRPSAEQVGERVFNFFSAFRNASGHKSGGTKLSNVKLGGEDQPGHYGQHRGKHCAVIATTASGAVALMRGPVSKSVDIICAMVKSGKARLVESAPGKVFQLNEGEEVVFTNVFIPLKRDPEGVVEPPAGSNNMPPAASLKRLSGILGHCKATGKDEMKIAVFDLENIVNMAKGN